MSSMVLDGVAARSRSNVSSLDYISGNPKHTEAIKRERFARIVKAGECWTWQGRLNKSGYGRVGVGTGRDMPVHRWVYEQLCGPIPTGMELDHLCRNRACVAPNHLEPVTRQENARRAREAMERGAHKDVCKYGHAMIPENLVVRKSRLGADAHECRKCIRDRNSRKYRKRRGGVVGPPNADKSECKNGHQFDEKNTYLSKQGARRCRTCSAASQRRTTQKRKAGLL